jgi:hypothetical protein
VSIPKQFKIDLEDAICSRDGMRVHLKGDRIKEDQYMDTVYKFDFENCKES